MLPIETHRLVLRALVPEDARVVANLVGNWNVVRWLARAPFPYTIADAEAFIVDATIRPAKDVGTIAAITRDGEVVGLAGIEPNVRGVELGYWLGETFWGNGYMTEAVSGLVAAYFRNPNAPALSAGYFEGNIASARILSKHGFEEVGRDTMYSRAHQQQLPDIDMRLTPVRYRTFHARTVHS
jgi:RimJ/RimL family protein N-acetyltransferase